MTQIEGVWCGCGQDSRSLFALRFGGLCTMSQTSLSSAPTRLLLLLLPVIQPQASSLGVTFENNIFII